MTQTYPLMQPEMLERYLDILGVPRRKPSLANLYELVQAHLFRVPFDSLSKLYYKQHRGLCSLPGLELYLDGIARFNFGGTCYTNNFYFYQLLANLGYQIWLCGADMTNPDVHLVSIVTLEGREYLVDVGYAAPFAAPLPRDLTTDYIIELGRDRYVFKPQDAQGRSVLELHRAGTLRHGYTVKPQPRQIGEFEGVIADSFRTEATFMKALLLARFFPNRSLVIHNLNVVESQGSEFKSRTLASTAELAQAVQEYFAIPAEVVTDVLAELDISGDAWS